MKHIEVLHVDAFSQIPNKGNPAGVVLEGDSLTEDEMQAVALQVGFNETAFAVRSEVADVRIRFFTPGHEMNLCGHATMATVFSLLSHGLLEEKREITIETKAGILPVKIQTMPEGEVLMTMRQAAPQFADFNGSVDELAAAIGLVREDIETRWPIQYGSTGIWTLIVPVKSLDACKRMKPDNTRFPHVLPEMPHVSIHPFCMETYDQTADMHARHFSSPYSGTVEDPVTGTASGVMGAYFVTCIEPETTDGPRSFVIEQGQEIDRDGRVHVTVTPNQASFQVEITGTAVFVKEMIVTI